MTGSDRPVPRLSNRISREKLARRRRNEANDGSSPEVVQVRDPAHHEHQVHGPIADDLVGDVDRSAARVVRLRNRAGGPRQLRRLRRHRCNEAIAAAMDRLDIRGLRGVIVQRTPNLANADLECRFADIDARPTGAEQLILGREMARPFREVRENRQRFRLEWNDLPRAPQARLRRLETKRAKRQGRGRGVGHRHGRCPIVYKRLPRGCATRSLRAGRERDTSCRPPSRRRPRRTPGYCESAPFARYISGECTLVSTCCRSDSSRSFAFHDCAQPM